MSQASVPARPRIRTRTRTHRVPVGLAVVALATTTALVAAPGGAEAAHSKGAPGLRLITGVSHLEIDRFDQEPQLYLNDVGFLEAVNAKFELDVHRVGGGVRIDQVRRHGGKTVVVRHVHPDGKATMSIGLPKFFALTLRDTAGHQIASQRVSFCPDASYDSQRVDPHSVSNPTFPSTCGDRLTREIPWGIDAGWAAGVSTGMTVGPQKAPDGKYTLQVSVAPTYARQFHIPRDSRSVTLTVTIKTESDGCTDVCPRPGVEEVAFPGGGSGGDGSTINVPVKGHPTQLLPDLESLPAHDLSIQNTKSGKSIVGFGATIWNRGPGSFDVEGFRQGHRPKMEARQYIDRPGKSPKSVRIGHFEYDTRQGHHHWHLEDVAQYSLLNSSGTNIVRSRKQSFCLAPTDPVNLMRPGSMWQPNSLGLESNCPTDQGLWLREALPVGWGDTYFQSVAGQAFNITGLANGTYFLQVRANPFGHIRETRTDNNTSYLKITLGGTPGHRTVETVKAVRKP